MGLTKEQENKKALALKALAAAYVKLGFKTDTPNDYGLTVIHPMGTSFYIYSDYLGRTKCCPSYLKSNVQRFDYAIKCESIGFDIFKPTEKIIADIEKRFLNQFIAASLVALDDRDSRDNEEKKRQNLRRDVSQLFGEKLTPEYSGEIISGYVGPKKHYVKADIKSTRLINLTLNDLSFEQVQQIKEILK